LNILNSQDFVARSSGSSDYLVEMEVVRQFLDECCSTADEFQASRLDEAFVSWCEDPG
jgi:hypothetical protein